MPGLADDLQVEVVGACQHRPSPEDYLAEIRIAERVRGDDGIDLWVLKRPVLDHLDSAARRGLLRRLKQHAHITFERFFDLIRVQDERCAQRHRTVGVVPAGVHLTGVF